MKTSCFPTLEATISMVAVEPTSIDSLAIIHTDAASGRQVLFCGDTQSQWFLDTPLQGVYEDKTLCYSFELKLFNLNGVGIYRVVSIETL